MKIISNPSMFRIALGCGNTENHYKSLLTSSNTNNTDHQHSVQVAADDHDSPTDDLFHHMSLSLKMFSETNLPVSQPQLGILSAQLSYTVLDSAQS